MEKVNSIGISDIIKHAKEQEVNSEVLDFEEEVEEVEVLQIPSEAAEIAVEFDSSVEVIELAEIRDEVGRISDLVESIEDSTGLSVIPLEMGRIAPEVVELQRHELFELDGRRFAMSHRKREKVLESYKNRIIKVLTAGLPFRESLNVLVEYDGQDYSSLALSRDEWTYLMAAFRKYKERLYVDNGLLFLEIQPERVD